jgi:hypothetical protein
MRRLLAFAAAAAWAWGAAGGAAAAPLNWSGTSNVVVSDLGDVLLFGGGVATVNDSSGVVPAHLQTLRLKASRGNVRGSTTILITDPVSGPANSIAALQFLGIEIGTGTIAPVSGGALSNTPLTQNVLPVQGVAKLCLVDAACTNFLQLPLVEPLTSNGVTTAIKGVGVGGILFVGNGVIRISVEAAPWTIKTAIAQDQILTPGNQNTTIVPLTAQGFAHGPISQTTSTAQPSGVVQLVSPAQVTTNLAFGTSEVLGIVLVYTVHFIPEPGMLLLLGSGVVGLLLLGRSKLRR